MDVGRWFLGLVSLVFGTLIKRHRISYNNNDAQMEVQSHTLDAGWHLLANSDIIPLVQHQSKVFDLT